MDNQTQSRECCPEFKPGKWDKKTFSWDNKKFIKDSLPTFFRDPSAFRLEIYVSVEKDVPSEKTVAVSGDFVSGVFDGDYNAVPEFIKIMDRRLTETGKKAKDHYVHYAYCPVCAKKFGHNYLTLFAKI